MADVAQLLVDDLVRHHSDAPWSIDGNVVGQGGKSFGDADDWIQKVQGIFADADVVGHQFGRLMTMRAQLERIGISVEIGGRDEY
jgi:hypothetical protein